MSTAGVRPRASGVRDGGTAPRLILASSSPRRRELIERLGLAFDVVPADVDESPMPGEAPGAMALRLAEAKALAVAHVRPDALVIGSDTIVVVDGAVLGKPEDEEEAVRMLLRLEGRGHRVETGIAVVAPPSAGGKVARVASSTVGVDVRFRSFDEEFARVYVRTGEPLDKAGAYGIQGYGSALVERIDGDYFAVMGLPVTRMLRHIEELGWGYRFADGLKALGARH
ncbi:MAG TPA: Maf family protein [Longimicrobiales bacterium]|nr:Maf family protein [Longimicrobiales bacterium]